MTIKISNMTIEEQKKLLEDNLKFRDYIYNECYDRICDMLNNEYLYNFPGFYEYSCVYATKVSLTKGRSYYSVDWQDVLDWIEKVEHDYCFLDFDGFRNPVELCKKAILLEEKLNDYNWGNIDMSDKNAERIQNRIDEIQEELEKNIKCAIDVFLDSVDDVDYLKEELEFLDYCLDDLYIDDNGAIFQEIHKYI